MLRQTLLHRDVLLLSIQYFCWSVGVYGFVIWLPSMLKAAGETSIVLVGWLSAGPYLDAAALMIIGSYFSDASGNRKNFVWPFLLIGAVLVTRDTIRRRGRWGVNARSLAGVPCPRCGEPLPAMRVPKNLNQTLWGGWTCDECGCEVDKWGREVEGDR